MNQLVLSKRAKVLSDTIIAISEIYHSEVLDEGQKGMLETLIGAGIWYLPSSKKLFSGMISNEALNRIRLDSGVKLVEEHGFPRKVAGKKLLSEHLEELKIDDRKLEELYTNKMGKFNLVLKDENNRLKKFQKTSVFIDESAAYNSAGIKLVPVQNIDYELPPLKKYKI
jgi:hypothetical protein